MDLEVFRRKYNARAFDDDDPCDAIAEAHRRLVVRTFLDGMEAMHPADGEQMQYAIGGMLIGIVNVAGSMIESTDKAHADLRAGLIQMMPWAVDMHRSMEQKDPLPEARHEGPPMTVMKDDGMWMWDIRVNGRRKFGWRHTKADAEKAESDAREELEKLTDE